jgi:hypothetical protein
MIGHIAAGAQAKQNDQQNSTQAVHKQEILRYKSSYVLNKDPVHFGTGSFTIISAPGRKCYNKY